MKSKKKKMVAHISTINQVSKSATTRPNSVNDTKNFFVHPPLGAPKSIQGLKPKRHWMTISQTKMLSKNNHQHANVQRAY